MKLGITSKLFLAIFTACLLVAIAMAAAVRISFHHGFVDYLDTQEDARVKQLAVRLELLYKWYGSWRFIQSSDSSWRAVLQNTLPYPGDTQLPGIGLGAQGPNAPHMPSGESLNDLHPEDFRTPPVQLFDAQMTRIAGSGFVPPDAAVQRLMVQGQTIGWLRVASPGHMFYAADQQFQAQQLRATWMIVGLAALLAAGIAMVLARLFLAPARRLVLATHRLADGDYATRIDETGSDELHQLARNFNQLAQALEAAELSRRKLIADISHELRTPLAILRGELEAIVDGMRTLDGNAVASLQAEVGMLSQLIDDLYELSLADIGALSFQKVTLDIGALVVSATEVFRDRLAAKRIRLDVVAGEVPVPMYGDPHRLAQLIKNLLENSLRYTDPGGLVRVVAVATPEAICIDVEDSAPGVPGPLLSRLFERLFRVDTSRSRGSGGAGLGLALCELIVREHGGTIEATHSRLGGLWIKVRFLAGMSGNE